MEDGGSSGDDDEATSLVPTGLLDSLHNTLQKTLEREAANKAKSRDMIDALRDEVIHLRAALEKLQQQNSKATTLPPTPTPTQPTPDVDSDDYSDVPPPTKRHKRRNTRTIKPTPPLPTPVSNPFNVLPIEEPPELPAEHQPTTIPTPKPTTSSNPTVVVTPVSSTCPQTHKKTDTVPPIILHNKDNWIQISTILNSQKARYIRATNTREGIRITPATIIDYRSIHKILTQGNHSFHSFQLPSEKTIKVVIRGVPQSITNHQVLVDLTHQSYIPLQVTRLNGRFDRPAPLILVQLERKFQSIYNLKTLCGLDVTVEAKKLPSGPLQCHKCQRFGHTQPNCHAPYRCMKCAEPHSTHLCPKPSTTPAVCANCNSNHISSHHSCTQNPVNLKKTYASALKPTTSVVPKPIQTQKPQPAPKPQPTTAPTSSTPTFASLSFPLFEALLSTNPTPERITAFTTQLTHLKRILENP